ncbi:MAG TPA: S1 RNA-binding domain-containing protein, partial [Candidatus Wallbacteria bacterium]|nr:S1 RNA-binding domain-containing protein [Candidatus Wallbacteria bacterium]
SAPRPELSKYAPRITVIMINPEKVREVIGPGGKMIKSIVEATGAQIDIEDSGKISICSVDFEKSQKAIKMITDLTKEIQAGEVYTGKVVRLMNFGAFVEILPGRDGLVHISELAWQRTEKVEDVCKIGDEMTVKVMEIDSMNRINLSRRATMEKPEGFVERPPAPPRAPQGGGFNRGGGGGRR